jgi:hypothetical protein
MKLEGESQDTHLLLTTRTSLMLPNCWNNSRRSSLVALYETPLTKSLFGSRVVAYLKPGSRLVLSRSQRETKTGRPLSIRRSIESAFLTSSSDASSAYLWNDQIEFNFRDFHLSTHPNPRLFPFPVVITLKLTMVISGKPSRRSSVVTL